jgi:hypothetical protein
VTVEELRWRRENDLSDRFRQSSCPPAPLGGKDPTLLLESRSNSIPFALMRAAGSSLSCSGGKREIRRREGETETGGSWVVVAEVEIEERSGLVAAGWEEREKKDIGN